MGAGWPGATQCSVMQREPLADAQIRDLLFWSSAWCSGLGSAGLLRPGGGPPITQFRVYQACDALQQTISRLYRQAGIKLGSSHSGRRLLAARVLAATGDVETVQTILGHQHLNHSKPYLTVDHGLYGEPTN